MLELKYCKGMEAELAGVLFEPESASAKVLKHIADCDGCRRELDEIRVAMNLMDAWQAPEPSPFFRARMRVRLREERQSAPLGWLARLLDGRRAHMRPLAAMALTAMLLLGGGAYLDLSDWMQPARATSDEAVVHDLQTLDNNAQVLDTLEALSSPTDSANAGPSDGNSY